MGGLEGDDMTAEKLVCFKVLLYSRELDQG